MAQDSFQEKTEAATPKKREKAREEGQVAKSAEIASVAVLVLGISVIYFFGDYFYPKLMQVIHLQIVFEKIPAFDNLFCLSVLNQSVTYFFLIMAPVLAAVFLAAFAANYFQVGFHLSAKAIRPKLEKFDVIKGFGRLVSLRSFVELIKSLTKLFIIGAVAYFAIRGEVDNILRLYNSDIATIFLYVLKCIFKIFVWVLLIMVTVAVIDYLYQRWQFEKDLKMTKQEVKEEHKESEGDPQVKSRIRSIQMQAARKRMMQAVPDADVVVTNPTHLAVAIKYDPISMEAPKVLAKGAGQVAQRIKEIAADHNIPVVENKELARNLYKTIDIGDQIGSEFFRAVAELLAYVYKIKGKTIS
ncbi:MAG: flagellar biosynthesis protein FlhB [Deltaproteobacteria bacterium]|nr:flagellar biosynthesis protein FlhB [Deltaproteobacteria bacterium]